MAATEPIRDRQQIKALGEYFLQRGQFRNYVLLVMAAHTVLRISDLLRLRWSDVYDEERDEFLLHVTVTEHKTGKTKTFALNKQVLYALRLYLPHRRSDFIFSNNRKVPKPICRVQAWRILHTAELAVKIKQKVGCHGLRKTWGYHACRSGKIPPAVLMSVYNHTNFKMTMRYLGIEQDDVDKAYLEVELF